MRHVFPPAHSPIRLASLASGTRAVAFPRLSDRTRLTDELIARTGSEFVHLVDSGTSALRLAIRIAAACRPNRPIAIPSWACFDIVSAVMGENVPVVIYDIDPKTLCPIPSTIAAAADLKPCAIVLVHLFGVPVDVTKVRAVVDANTLLIEDCAQSWGAMFQSQHLGSQGDVSIFSFGRGKGITGGSGGAVALRRDMYAPASRNFVPATAVRPGFRDLLRALSVWAFSHPSVYAAPASMPFLRLGETRLRKPHPIEPISNAAAAIVSRNIVAANNAVFQRRERAYEYLHELPSDWVVQVSPDAEPGWLRFPVLAPDAETKKNWLVRLRDLGIAPGYPNPLSAILGDVGFPQSTTHRDDGGNTLANRLVTLPTHELISHDEALLITSQMQTIMSAPN